MSFSFSESILHQCDLIIDSTHSQLDVVKQIVKKFELNQHLLVDERARTLQDEVSNLRNENVHLRKELWQAKTRLRELCEHGGDDISEGNWDISTPPPKVLELVHRQGNMTQTPCSGAESFGIPNAETDFPDAVDEQLFPQQDTQETLFETQILVEVAEESRHEHACDPASLRRSVNVLDGSTGNGSTGNIGLMLAIDKDDGRSMEVAADCMSLSSTTTTAASSSASSSCVYHTPKRTTKKHRGRRVNKWYNSTPKKWRRMLRTHRLQSILLVGN